MWPLEKYARWDGKCWHQVNSDEGQLRLLIEVKTVCMKMTKYCTLDYQIFILSAKMNFQILHKKFWVVTVMEMLQF
jgi:hypothetical protein